MIGAYVPTDWRTVLQLPTRLPLKLPPAPPRPRLPVKLPSAHPRA